MSSLPPTCHFFFTNSVKSQIDKASQLDLLELPKCLIHEGVNQILYITEECKITPEIYLMGWVRPRWQSRKSLSSPPLMNPAKPQLPKEQSSMKMTKTYQKRSSTTKDIKKEPQ